MLGYIFFLIRRRPPRSTRTDTLFPYTTLFRSARLSAGTRRLPRRLRPCPDARRPGVRRLYAGLWRGRPAQPEVRRAETAPASLLVYRRIRPDPRGRGPAHRSEERRVGNGCVSPCRTRW